MTKYVKAIKDFSGGLSEVANDNIPDNRLVTAKNVVPGDGYGIARASGTSIAFEQIEDAGPVVFLAELVEDDSGIKSTHIIAGVEVTVDGEIMWNLYDWDGEEWTLVTDSNEEANTPPILSWFIYANKLFWLDGTNYNYYDGTNIAPVSNNSTDAGVWNKVKTATVVEARSAQWFFGTPNNEVIISDGGFYDKFTAVDIININSGVSDTITALHEFNDGMLIFQKRNIYYLTGWDLTGGTDIKMAKLSVESGTKWPKSVKTVSNAVLYLGDNGVYKLSLPYFTSSVAAKNISDKQASKRLTEAALDVYAEVFNGVYYIALRTSTTETKEYRYYLDAGSWWGEYTQQPRCYALKLGGDDKLFMGCGNGYILYYDPASTHYVNPLNGAAASIPIEVLTKGYDVVGGTVIDSKVKRIFIVLKQYDADKSGLTVQVKTDYTEGAWEANIDSMRGVVTAVLRDVSGDESLVWSEGIWSQAYWGWIDTVTKQFQLNKKCKRVQFKFQDDNNYSFDEPLLVYGIAMLYKKKKAKGSRMGVNEREVTYDN